MRIGYANGLCEWFTRELFPEDNFGPDNSALANLNGTIMHPAPHVSVECIPRGGLYMVLLKYIVIGK